jgi:hypothetical protein
MVVFIIVDLGIMLLRYIAICSYFGFIKITVSLLMSEVYANSFISISGLVAGRLQTRPVQT